MIPCLKDFDKILDKRHEDFVVQNSNQYDLFYLKLSKTIYVDMSEMKILRGSKVITDKNCVNIMV